MIIKFHKFIQIIQFKKYHSTIHKAFRRNSISDVVKTNVENLLKKILNKNSSICFFLV